jgi:hypothetical protein
MAALHIRLVPPTASVLERRYSGHLSQEETAAMLGVSRPHAATWSTV